MVGKEETAIPKTDNQKFVDTVTNVTDELSLAMAQLALEHKFTSVEFLKMVTDTIQDRMERVHDRMYLLANKITTDYDATEKEKYKDVMIGYLSVMSVLDDLVVKVLN